MTAALPLTESGARLSEFTLRLLRPLAAAYMNRRWDINERGQDYVPKSGPVILVSNHIGWLDGPLLVAVSPRPAHAWTKTEMFTGKTGRLLKFAGQINVNRRSTDAAALRQAVTALRANQVVVVYPEGTRGGGEFDTVKGGAAYLALVTGAPVVPVAIFGTRLSGEHTDARPAKGQRIDIVYGPPVRFDAVEWPRDKSSVAKANDELRNHLRAHVEDAHVRIKRELPGPLPAGDRDD